MACNTRELSVASEVKKSRGGGGGENEGNFSEEYWRQVNNQESNNLKLQTDTPTTPVIQTKYEKDSQYIVIFRGFIENFYLFFFGSEVSTINNKSPSSITHMTNRSSLRFKNMTDLINPRKIPIFPNRSEALMTHLPIHR